MQNFPVTVFSLGAACGRSISGTCTLKKKKIYSLFQSQQSSVEGKWEVKHTWMHNDHKPSRKAFSGDDRKQLFVFSTPDIITAVLFVQFYWKFF